MCDRQENIQLENFNPTFLFTWKGKRDQDEKRYHCHDFLEIAFMMSGSGFYRIDGQIYPVDTPQPSHRHRGDASRHSHDQLL